MLVHDLGTPEVPLLLHQSILAVYFHAKFWDIQVAVAGLLPAPLVPALIGAACLTALVFSARKLNRLTQDSRLWRVWQALMAVIGIITVPQVLWGTFTGSHSLVPAILASIPGEFMITITAIMLYLDVVELRICDC